MNPTVVSRREIVILAGIAPLISVAVALLIATRAPLFYFEVSLCSSGNAQVYYDIGRGIHAGDSATVRLRDGESTIRLPLPAGEYRTIRFDVERNTKPASPC